MARVLLLATTTGYQTRAFGDAADALGVELVFATDRCEQLDDPWQDGAVAIRFHEEERSVDAIVAAARERDIDGILAVGDRPTVIAARAAEALRLPWHPPEAAAIARHKQLTRERISAAGLPSPWFVTTTIEADPRRLAPPSFPCIVKPLSLSGSRGVMRADDLESFCVAFERLRALLRSPEVQVERNAAHGAILIEGFIPGHEYALEGLLHHGELHPLAIFDKPDPLDGPFFEETIYLTPSRAPAEDQQRIVDAVRAAALAIGLHHGPVHAECRVNDEGVYILEVAGRPIGGICARSLRFEPTSGNPRSSISLEDLLIRQSLGGAPDQWRREATASGVMMVPIPRRGIYRGVAGLENARAVAGVTDVRITAKPDQRLIPLPEGASYLGFIFARAEQCAAVDAALRAAHQCLSFQIEPEFQLLASSQIRYNQQHG
jgi:ATP-grasp domain/L-amino acid ligase C-terminal domain 2/ATP-grasp N-terminal domain